jgi:hypothetical protein
VSHAATVRRRTCLSIVFHDLCRVRCSDLIDLDQFAHRYAAPGTMRHMTLWQKSGGRWRIHREFVLPVGAPQQP